MLNLNNLGDVVSDSVEFMFKPPATSRFLVVIWSKIAGSVMAPNPLDIYFQSVSGLSKELDVESFYEGGVNTKVRHFPTRVANSGRVVLRRGVATPTPLSIGVLNTMENANKNNTINAITVLLLNKNFPVSAWHFRDVIPVRWAAPDLNANSAEFAINTFEFVYGRQDLLGARL